MLDLKAKLLAAGLVTAEQVKKVEDEESARKQRDRERRDAQRAGREQRGARQVSGGRHEGKKSGRPDARRDEADEKRAARDHREEEAQRWRKRLDDLKAAPKSEQYDIIRGWVQRHRIDDKKAVPSEEATRFHFARSDGTIGHITLEPDVQAQLTQGAAGIITFMGHNGVEHAVVPADLARDVAHVKPEWLRSLAGVTDTVDADAVTAAEETGVVEQAAPSVGEIVTEGGAAEVPEQVSADVQLT